LKIPTDSTGKNRCERLFSNQIQKKLKQKIAEAEAAIFERLQALSDGKTISDERQALDDATKALRVVKRGVLKFLDWRANQELTGEKFPRLLDESFHIVCFGYDRRYTCGRGLSLHEFVTVERTEDNRQVGHGLMKDTRRLETIHDRHG
jgi:hypothetical protein